MRSAETRSTKMRTDPDQDEEPPNQEEEQMDDSGHHEDPPSPIIPRWDRGTHRCFKRDRDNN